jgi:phenylacetate-CoA ligase
MRRVRGRTDDMLIVRGENVFPSQLEAILLEVEQLTGNYHLVVDRQAARLDTLEVLIEAVEGSDHEALSQSAQRRVRETIGLSVQVTVLAPGSLARSEGKAKRVVDRRDV